jgi:phosphoglycerate dehydrogenase-like enzyme
MRILLMYSLAPPSPAHLERLQQLGSGIELVVAMDETTALAAAGDAEVILGHRFLRQCLPAARRLRWVQTSAQGVDRLPLEALAEHGIVLTRSTLDAESVAIHAVAMAWSLTRAIPEAWRNQQAQSWDQRLRFAPMPGKALVMGHGPIGQSIARRLVAQGIETICAKRRVSGTESDSVCTRLVAGDGWRDELADADWCFLALPHSPETSGLFDENALRALPPHAVLVNVGRGETLDTAALQRVLDSGHLAGAGLDVVDPEPLPPEHPLWQSPRVLITPHVASHQPGRNERVEQFFERQVKRFLAGEALLDRVDLGSAIRQRPGAGTAR